MVHRNILGLVPQEYPEKASVSVKVLVKMLVKVVLHNLSLFHLLVHHYHHPVHYRRSQQVPEVLDLALGLRQVAEWVQVLFPHR